MKISEKNYHLFFQGMVILKAIYSIFETIAGIVLYFATYDALRSFIISIMDEDFPWQYFHAASHEFHVYPQSFWAFLLLTHGLIKLGFLIALWKEKLWAYPASAAAFAVFTIYAIIQAIFVPTALLIAIIILDIILIVLILHEYRYRRHGRNLV